MAMYGGEQRTQRREKDHKLRGEERRGEERRGEERRGDGSYII
jgi:hypothetical protein